MFYEKKNSIPMRQCKEVQKSNLKKTSRTRSKSRTPHFELLESRRLLAAGQLDLMFGNAGKVTTNIGDVSSYNIARDVVAYRSDGKFVVAGETDGAGGQRDFAVIRYNSDGSLDTSFGVDGIVTIDFGGGTDIGTAVAIDSSDRIVVAGYSLAKVPTSAAIAASVSQIAKGK